MNGFVTWVKDKIFIVGGVGIGLAFVQVSSALNQMQYLLDSKLGLKPMLKLECPEKSVTMINPSPSVESINLCCKHRFVCSELR